MRYDLTIRSTADDIIYTRAAAAQMAQISLELLRACEQEGILQMRQVSGGTRGYSTKDVRHMVVIRRLHEDLELDISSVDVVLHMRQRVIDLLSEMDEMEARMNQREQELINEIGALRRRLAEDAEWGP
ncbi:MerR family transcriptional regulator [Chloroflexota bacterium]